MTSGREKDSETPLPATIHQESRSVTQAPLSVREGYVEVLYWRITEKPWRIATLQILSIPLMFVWGILFYWLARALGEMPLRFGFSPWTFLILLVGTIAGVMVVHELAHGWTMRFFGGRPEYGVMWKQMLVYATTPGVPYTRKQFLLITFAPLISITTLCLVLMVILSGSSWVFILFVAATINTTGAIGDLWIAFLVKRYPPTALVVDERDGVRILLPSEPRTN